MGGSWYLNTGGGSNYLCLPLNPIFDKIISGSQGNSYLYGTEYQESNIFPQNINDHDAPCAVCHTESRGSHVMIPARNVWFQHVIKVISCQPITATIQEHSSFVLTGTPKVQLDLKVVTMVH
jgi:hypothetical protein